MDFAYKLKHYDGHLLSDEAGEDVRRFPATNLYPMTANEAENLLEKKPKSNYTPIIGGCIHSLLSICERPLRSHLSCH